MCLHALLTRYFPESCEKIAQACYSGGIRTHNSCNSRAVSYQLDYRGGRPARGSSNPMFWQRGTAMIQELGIFYLSFQINEGQYCHG